LAPLKDLADFPGVFLLMRRNHSDNGWDGAHPTPRQGEGLDELGIGHGAE
jgi:hypothetical protein